jgi:excisionase family DNA binding protein
MIDLDRRAIVRTEPRYLTAAEAAQRIGVSRQTFYTYVKRYKLPFTGNRKIRTADLDRWWKSFTPPKIGRPIKSGYHCEEETELQRTRRRIQERRCAYCGTPIKDGRYRLCPIHDSYLKYCPGCETVKEKAYAFARNRADSTGYCQRCVTCDAVAKGKPGLVEAVQRRADQIAQADALAARIARLRAAEMAWRDVAARVGHSIHAVRGLYYRWERRQQKAST